MSWLSSSFVAFVLALLFLPAVGVRAQEPDTVFEVAEVVVTATKLPLPVEAVPAAVTVLSGESLRARQVPHLLDALRAVPSLHIVQTGGPGGATSLFLRGGEADYVQLLVDGVPVNEPGGRIDLATYATDDIERIEVVRGPASVLYGSAAVTGVIQVFTRTGEGPASLIVDGQAGSYGTVDGQLAARGGGVRFGWSLSAGTTRSDGIFDFNSSYRNDLASGTVRWSPDPRTRVRGSLRWSDSEYHYPTDAAGNVVDRNAFQQADRLTWSVDAARVLFGPVRARLLVGGHTIDGGINDRADGPADTLGFFGYVSAAEVTRRHVDGSVDVGLGERAILTIGATWEETEEHSTDTSFSEYGDFPGRFDARRDDRGYYGQLFTHVGGGSVSAGVRREDNSAFGEHTTWRVGTTAPLGERVLLRAAAGTAFKEPTFFQNFASGFVTGNPALEPEQSESWEVGATATPARGIELDATWFDQRFTNLIDYTGAPTVEGGPNYYNIAAAEARGLELSARARLLRVLELGAGYTWLHTEVTDTAFAGGPDAELGQGARLLRRPEHAGHLSLGWLAPRGASAHLAVHMTGEREDFDFAGWPAERVTLARYTRVDASGTFPLRLGGAPELALTLRVENVFDADYQEVFAFPARGRTILLGGRVTLTRQP